MAILKNSDLQTKEVIRRLSNLPPVIITVRKCNTSVSSWKKKFIRDIAKKEFLPIKGLFFLIYGANMALIPFLTLQARSLGITEKEVGLIYSFIPIAAIIAPALSGMLADSIGNFKILLSIVTAVAGLCGLLFLAVPVGREIYVIPENLPFEISCFQEGSKLNVIEPYQCDISESIRSFDLWVHECKLICTNETVKMEPNLQCGNSLNCIANETKVQLELLDPSNVTDSNPYLSSNLSQYFNIIINVSRQEDDNANQQDDKDLYSFSSSEHLCTILDQNNDYDDEVRCYTSCFATSQRDKLCSNKETVIEINPQITFYSHLFIRLIKEFTLATSMPLLDGAAVTILREHKGDFGFQRMFCNLGMMIATPISGILIDYFSIRSGKEDYRPALFMYCALKLVAAFIILFLSMEFKQASKKVISEFSTMILNVEIIIFLMATFMAGAFYGYIETFLFWLLEDLGADKKLMGITVTVGAVFGIPVLMVSSFILKKFGYVNTICAGFAVYIVRLIGYTLISSPWWAMPFEALECISVSLMTVSFVSYASELASPGIMVTLQGMHGGLYNGVGRGAGSFIGGYLIERIGIFNTFKVMAVVSGVSGILYFAANFFIQLNRQKKVASKEASKDIENIFTIERKCSTVSINGSQIFHDNEIINFQLTLNRVSNGESLNHKSSINDND